MCWSTTVINFFYEHHTCLIQQFVGQNAALFLIIPYLITSPLVSSIKKKSKWKPSKREAQEPFVLHINTIDELSPTLERQREKCLQNGDMLQPIPVLVGNNFDKLTCFISVERVLYQIENVLSCVDTSFKLYHSLRAEYPSVSRHV